MAMAQPISTRDAGTSPRPQAGWRCGSAVIWGAAGLGGAVVLAAALALWFHYGTAVFFEMIAAGFAACF